MSVFNYIESNQKEKKARKENAFALSILLAVLAIVVGITYFITTRPATSKKNGIRFGLVESRIYDDYPVADNFLLRVSTSEFPDDLIPVEVPKLSQFLSLKRLKCVKIQEYKQGDIPKYEFMDVAPQDNCKGVSRKWQESNTKK